MREFFKGISQKQAKQAARAAGTIASAATIAAISDGASIHSSTQHVSRPTDTAHVAQVPESFFAGRPVLEVKPWEAQHAFERFKKGAQDVFSAKSAEAASPAAPKTTEVRKSAEAATTTEFAVESFRTYGADGVALLSMADGSKVAATGTLDTNGTMQLKEIGRFRDFESGTLPAFHRFDIARSKVDSKRIVVVGAKGNTGIVKYTRDGGSSWNSKTDTRGAYTQVQIGGINDTFISHLPKQDEVDNGHIMYLNTSFDSSEPTDYSVSTQGNSNFRGMTELTDLGSGQYRGYSYRANAEGYQQLTLSASGVSATQVSPEVGYPRADLIRFNYQGQDVVWSINRNTYGLFGVNDSNFKVDTMMVTKEGFFNNEKFQPDTSKYSNKSVSISGAQVDVVSSKGIMATTTRSTAADGSIITTPHIEMFDLAAPQDFTKHQILGKNGFPTTGEVSLSIATNPNGEKYIIASGKNGAVMRPLNGDINATWTQLDVKLSSHRLFMPGMYRNAEPQPTK